MSLNHIQLTPQLLVDLYQDVLIETVTESEPATSVLSYLGKNEKNILIITSKTEVRFLTDGEFDFLTSILSACKLGNADVAIVNWKQTEKNLQEILLQLQSKTVLLFDVNPLEVDLPLNFPHFQIQHFDKQTYLYAPSLEEIANDVVSKKQLWNSLKKLFEI